MSWYLIVLLAWWGFGVFITVFADNLASAKKLSSGETFCDGMPDYPVILSIVLIWCAMSAIISALIWPVSIWKLSKIIIGQQRKATEYKFKMRREKLFQ